MQIRTIAMLAVSAASLATPAFAADRIAAAGTPQAAQAPVSPPPPPVPAPAIQVPAPPLAPPALPHGSRWGAKVDGRWEGGARAPGGWGAYRRLARGQELPRYWIAPRFTLRDFARYGLGVPPQGYFWVRYYDDAVLIDSAGHVLDVAAALDWGRFDGDYAEGWTAYSQGYAGGYGAGYPAPVVTYAQPLPPGGYVQSYGVGGYASGVSVNGVWYPAGTATTITIQSAPVVTTTVTEYVTEREIKVRRVYRKPLRKWHPKPRRRPACECAVKGS